LHGFIGERIKDIESCKKLVKKICENYHLPYFTITPTFSICPKHGYLPGEHKYCPKCDTENGYEEGGEKVMIPVEKKVEANTENDNLERSLIQAMA
jgi:ribonucleoside-triphosphate reductase (formate)